MLTAAFVYGLIQFSAPDWLQDSNGRDVTIFGIGAEAVVGVGALVIGFVLLLVWRRMRPDYFRGLTLPKRSAE